MKGDEEIIAHFDWERNRVHDSYLCSIHVTHHKGPLRSSG